MRIAWSERRGGIRVGGGEGILDEIQEVEGGEDRQLIQQIVMAKSYVTDAKGRDTCLMYVQTRRPLETVLAKI